MRALVTIYVVTYRRPVLLARALKSVIAQSFKHWVVKVVNDDPLDLRVAEVVSKLRDDRIQLFQPVEKRGAARNFNLAFTDRNTPFASLLEDDNWWEPHFLERMLSGLEAHPHCQVACGNELIWVEQSDGSWKNRGETIWKVGEGDLEWITDVYSACGSAKLCNSSMLFKTQRAQEWLTPMDIPVDVTEHFRERVMIQPLLLVHEPLVNYAQTIATYRATRGSQWADYQCLLIGSCFHSMDAVHRGRLAQGLYAAAGERPSPRSTALLLAGLAIQEARALWTFATRVQKWRFLQTLVRRPLFVTRVARVKARLGNHWRFLLNSAFNLRIPSQRGMLFSSNHPELNG